MADRKYSVAEIDLMRRYVAATVLDFSMTPEFRAATIEERLRTYMLNGTDPDELRVVAEKSEADFWERENSRLGAKPGGIRWMKGCFDG